MQAVLIAGGESSRFWPLANRIHKCQVKLLGKSLLYWTLQGLAENGIKEVVIVHGRDSSIREMFEQENNLGLQLHFALQKEPLGTGNALWQAKQYITQPFFLLHPTKVNAGQFAQQMLGVREQTGAEIVLVGAKTPTPWEYGMVRFEGGEPAEIVENPEQGKEPSDMKTLGTYLLPSDFFAFYDTLPQHHEADLIDAINLCLEKKKSALVKIEKDIPTLKYPWELFGILDILFGMQKTEQFIASSAKIGEGTVIKGQVYIGEDCEIGAYNVLRGPLSLERGVKTEAFCEIKHSIVQEETHFHSGYIGDSLVGKNCRFGAGFVSANRRLDRAAISSVIKDKKVDTGLTHWGTVVGDNAHIGIHAGTMPGVFIGSHAIIGPGTIAFEHVPDHTALYTKFEQVTKRD
jgi:UDP-N-acetylglucosamine diphosphorylase / glucose-1-phosphate thymidylyltransferase / UDP-N-acetylgalactosamine diphosphorylase / glucosamine-1-phosphate N-acetyltransferase / galactosamine-1-phosphate N-acetyltransferase